MIGQLTMADSMDAALHPAMTSAPIPSLILASQSPARARLCAEANLQFAAKAANVDEVAIAAALGASGAPPRDIADALAEAKAIKLSRQHPAALVLGADQLLVLDNGSVIHKAADRDDAAAILRQLSGRQHRLFSAAVAAEGGNAVWRHVGTATIGIRPLSDATIARYLDAHWPDVAGCVGCYQVEGAGVQLFDKVDGDRWTIMGMPMLQILAWLRLRGVVQ